MTIDQGHAKKTTLRVVFFVLFLDLVGFGMLFPLVAGMLTWYQQHDHGVLHWAMDAVARLVPGADTGQQAALFGGLIGAVYSMVQFFAAPFWGRLSDRIGRRPVLLLSLTGSFAANLIWVFSGEFTLLLLSRLLAGAMNGNISVANAAVADLTPPDRRARAMGMVGMAFGLGFVLGPAIGGGSYVLAKAHLPWLASGPGFGLNPFSATAALAALLALINLIWALRSFTETLPPERRGTLTVQRIINPLRLFGQGLPPMVPRLNAAFALHTLLFAGMEATLVFLAAQRCGFDEGHTAGVFVWMGVMAALVQGGIYRRIAHRADLRHLCAMGLAVMIPGFAMLALVDTHPSTALFLAGVSVLSLGTGLVFPSLSAITSLAGDATNQGFVLGTFRSAGSLGRAVGPLLAALLYFLVSPAAPYWFGASGIILPLVLILGVAKPLRQSA